RAHPLRGEEDVDAAARTEVENRFALTQIGDSGRVPAPQAGLDCAGGEVAEIGDGVAVTLDLDAEAGVGGATVRTVATGTARGGDGVALPDLLPDVGGVAHGGGAPHIDGCRSVSDISTVVNVCSGPWIRPAVSPWSARLSRRRRPTRW